jgi:hypothetical protein
MNAIVPISLSFLLGGFIVNELRSNKKEGYSSVIEARPNYKSTLTPRYDSNVNADIIRGTPPSNMETTSYQSYPITQEGGRSVSNELNLQYNINQLNQFGGLNESDVIRRETERRKREEEELLLQEEEQRMIEIRRKEEEERIRVIRMNEERKIKEMEQELFLKAMIKNAPPPTEYFSEKIKLSSDTNNKMSHRFEPIDEPADISVNDFAKLGDIHNKRVQKAESSRPDLSYTGAQLPKLSIDNKFKDPTDPSNYMYDRTLFAPLKRRNGGNQTDFIRGDIYVAPNKFGWFDVPSNPGTDLNPGFFNLNYPSYEENVVKEDMEVKRANKSLSLADLENIQRNNPFSDNFMHRP